MYVCLYKYVDKRSLSVYNIFLSKAMSRMSTFSLEE